MNPVNEISSLNLVETEKKDIKRDLVDVIDNFKPELGEDPFTFEARKSNQKKIIEALPDDLLDRLASHIKYEALIAKKENKDLNVPSKLKGEFFENIVVAEMGLFSEEKEELTPTIKELTILLKRPPIIAMQAIGHFRKPDLLKFKEENSGGLSISKMVEIKTHALTENDVDQIRQFKSGFRKFEDAVAKQGALRGMGFPNIFPVLSAHKITFAPDFHTELVVPRDVTRDTLINEGTFRRDPQKIDKAKESLANVQLTNSLFSRDELALMFNVVYSRVEKPNK